MARNISDQYEYKNILAKDRIRILTLHPASELDAPLYGDLDEAPLERESNYATLSYSWGMNKDGDATLNRIIYISGGTLAITQNLFEGLKRIRDAEVSRRVWIDAVCINQSDVLERNAQVSQMAKIYSCSNHLIIWLGEGESEVDDSLILHLASFDLEQCAKNNDAARTGCSTICSDLHSLRIDGQIVNFHETVRALLATDEYSDMVEAEDTYIIEDALDRTDVGSSFAQCIRKTIEIALNFFLRRYWRRRWIAQELYHSRNCTFELRWGACLSEDLWQIIGGPLWKIIQSASHLISDYDFLSMRNVEKELASPIQDADSAREAIGEIQQLMSHNAGMTFDEFTNALFRFSCMACSDDRDRLFALSSLSPDYVMEPDYSMTTTQVYINFASQFIQKGLLTALLESSNERLIGEDKSLVLPSWVPDLRSTNLDLTRSTTLEVDNTPLVDGDIIKFKARHFGTVEATSSGMNEVAKSPHSIACLNREGCSVLWRMRRPYRESLVEYGDCVFVLSHRHAHSSPEDLEKLALVLRKQPRTRHGQNVYRLVTTFDYKLSTWEEEYMLGNEAIICIA